MVHRERADAAGRVPLSRAVIVETAMRLADDGALAEVTMRRVASELGVTAMSLYGHIADKDELLDAILDRRLATFDEPAPGLGWRAWMADSAARLRSLLVDEPVLLERYGRRPVAVPAALVRMERSLQVLRDAGFSDDGALDVFVAVHTYTIGFATLERSRAVVTQTSSVARPIGGSQPGYWPLLFGLLDAHDFPVLSSTRPDLATFTHGDRFALGIEALLRGFAPDR